MKPLVGNAADEEQVKEAGSKMKRGRERELGDFRAVMETPYGRRLINRLIQFCGVFRTSFTGNSTTFYNEGQRNVGLMLMSDINEACPDLYMHMLSENRSDEENPRRNSDV